MRQYLKEVENFCTGKYLDKAAKYDDHLRYAQAELKRTSEDLSPDQRQNLHCTIQNLRLLTAQAHALANDVIPIAYENREAKLDLIEQWPGERLRTEELIESGMHHKRKFGDVEDIGFRGVGEGQEEDIGGGMEAIREMRQSGLLPPEIENEFVANYVRRLAERIAANSDLGVPVNVTLLNAAEVNAFALPGGFLFVQRGLLEAAEDEAQLAGVIAHELAHVAARHGHQLMRRATIASVIYQLTQVAALILTGGVSGAGAYYALQYGFYGLGFILNLNILGVSREFELEADQLGVQYAWKTGYDTSGFIRFFDEMATTEGYVNGASWFRTHPPFYERMVETQREILFLQPREETVIQTSEFEEMKGELTAVVRELEGEGEREKRPSLRGEEIPKTECPAPGKLYEPEEPIEALCVSADPA